MPRLIDADKLIELCNIMADKCDGIGKSIWEQFATTVEWSPTVDAVPLEDYKSMEQTVNKLTKAIADAEPVRHGHWQKRRNPMLYQIYPYVAVCSRCGTAFEIGTPYCGECGAIMDEVRDE